MTAPRWKWVALCDSVEHWVLEDPQGLHRAFVRFEARRDEAGALPWRMCTTHLEPRWYATLDAAMTAAERHVTALLNPVAIGAERPEPPPPKWTWRDEHGHGRVLRDRHGQVRARVWQDGVGWGGWVEGYDPEDKAGASFVSPYASDVLKVLRHALGADVPHWP